MNGHGALALKVAGVEHDLQQMRLQLNQIFLQVRADIAAAVASATSADVLARAVFRAVLDIGERDEPLDEDAAWAMLEFNRKAIVEQINWGIAAGVAGATLQHIWRTAQERPRLVAVH